MLVNTLFLMVGIGISCTLQASEMVYTPINPSFGGSPLNGSSLLANANAINQYTDPKSSSGSMQTQRTPLEQFNNTLQQYVLSRIASSVSGSLFGTNGQLIPGTVETQDFTISIVSLGNGAMQITTTDKATGQSTMFQVGQ